MVAQAHARRMTVEEWRTLLERSAVTYAMRYQAVEVYRRPAASTPAHGWTVHVYRSGEELLLTSIDVRLPAADLYRLTEVPASARMAERTSPARDPQ